MVVMPLPVTEAIAAESQEGEVIERREEMEWGKMRWWWFLVVVKDFTELHHISVAEAFFAKMAFWISFVLLSFWLNDFSRVNDGALFRFQVYEMFYRSSFCGVIHHQSGSLEKLQLESQTLQMLVANIPWVCLSVLSAIPEGGGFYSVS